MNRTSKLFVLLLVISVLVVFTGYAQEKEKDTVTCPVSGKAFNKSDAADMMTYNGKTYYFCCDNCMEAFKKNPEKYIEAMAKAKHEHAEHQEAHVHAEHAEAHVHAEHAEKMENDTAVDPVCGMKIKKADAKTKYEYNGKTYYFCMEGCKEKFVADPEKYVKKEDGQMVCSVSGEKFTKKENSPSSTYNGKTYTFCCAGCKAMFDKDPEKYTKKKDSEMDGNGNGSKEACAACAVKKK
jgi:YHS domain-containing protein